MVDSVVSCWALKSHIPSHTGRTFAVETNCSKTCLMAFDDNHETWSTGRVGSLHSAVTWIRRGLDCRLEIVYSGG